MLIIAGFMGNYCTVPLFFGADFLVGGIAVLLILYCYGLSWGMFAAVIVHIYTLVLWGHPYGFINFTSEALFVGIFLKRGHRNLLGVDWVFWLAIGMPMAWLYHGVVMHMGAVTATFIMFKQAINGIFNALAATLIIYYVPLGILPQRPQLSQKTSLQESLFNLLVSIVLIPTLLLTIFEARREKERLEVGIMADLQSLSANVQFSLRSWYHINLKPVQELAALAGQSSMTPSAQLQHETEILTRSFPDFASMHVTDAEGRTVAFEPRVNGKKESTIGLDFSGRAWFQKAKTEQQPVVSEVFMGQAAALYPIIVLSVPVIRENHWLGCATAALNLTSVQEILRPYLSDKMAGLTFTDSQSRVIASTRSERTPMQSWNWKESGVPEVLGNMMFLLRPDDKGLPAMTRWMRSYYVLETSLGPELPWKLIAEAPVAPLQHVLYNIYIKNLAIMVCLTTLALLLSQIFSRRLARPLAKLAQVTANLPEKLSGARSIVWPASSTREVDSLIGNFGSMTKALEANFHELRVQGNELRQVNLGLEQEIQERKHAEEKLEQSVSLLNATLESTVDGILVVDRKGGVVSFNRKFADMWHLNIEVLSSRDYETYLLSVLPQLRDPEGFLNRVQELYEQPEVQSFDTIELTDGRVFERYSQPQYLVDVAVGRVWSYRDVTQRRRAEEEKENLQAQLRQAHKMEAVGTLAGGIAHDFNNILTSIIGYTELSLTKISRADPALCCLEQVLNAGLRAKDLVKQILVFSRMKRYQERVHVEIGPVIKDALKLLRASLPTTIVIRQNIEIETSTALADPTEIHQVLVNLCTNAAHAMEETGGVLEVSLTEVAIVSETAGTPPGLNPGHYLRLTVSDTGHGMDSATLEHIFDPYFTTKGVGKGSGLGLAVVHGILERHQGKIVVYSKPGEGTTFNVYLPKIESVAALKCEIDTLIPKGNERIIFVDDEEVLADLGQQMLEHLGYSVLRKTSSVEALELFMAQPEHFDLVVTDYTMPQMTGADLAKEVMRIRPDIPVILCTGFTERITEEKAKDMGIRAFLMKPLSLRDVAESVRNALDKK
ncbi:MAG: ATP-binding protein [Syntrophobacteraceae bacterium]